MWTTCTVVVTLLLMVWVRIKQVAIMLDHLLMTWEIFPVALNILTWLLLKLVLDAHLLLEKALDGHSTCCFGALLAAG